MITPIVFILMFVAGVISAISITGSWGFYLYQIIYFANPASRWWSSAIPAIPYSMIAVLTMIIAWLLQRSQLHRYRLSEPPQLKWVIFIAILLSITELYAVSPERHHEAALDFWKMLAVLFLAHKFLNTEQKLETALLVYTAGAFYIGWEAYSVGRNGWGRVEGIGMVDAPDANGFAAALVPAIPILIYFFWRGTNWQRFLSVALGVWIANAIVLINSRGAFLGVVVGGTWLLGAMLISRQQSGSQRLIAISIIIVSVATALYLTDDLFWERMGTLTEIEDESKSGSHRYRMWVSAVKLASDYPGGVGAYGFQQLSPFYVDRELFFNGQSTKSVHSTWFQALSEIGWIGLGCFLALLGSCCLSAKAIRKKFVIQQDTRGYFRTVTLDASMLGYLVAGSFIDVFRAQILYWLVLFYAVQHTLYLKDAQPALCTDSLTDQ